MPPNKKPTVDQLKNELLRKRPKEGPLPAQDFLSTGSTLLNLACSGKPNGGLAKGTYTLLVGDSASGKTFCSMSLFTEASVNKHFKDYRLIFDNAENGAMIDLGKYFPPIKDRLEPPHLVKGEPEYSATVEDFYDNLDAADKVGKPFIYILDSMDALTSEDEESHVVKKKKATDEEGKSKGSYGTSRAKLNSSRLRVVANQLLRRTGSILVIISQTRDNIGFGAQYNKKTFSGGRALTFYAHLIIWTSVMEKIKKHVAGKDRIIGIGVKAEVKKNRLTGRTRSVEFPILYSHGIDDTGSMVDWLIDEKVWKKSKETLGDEKKERGNGQYNTGEFGSGTVEKLIQKIESEGRERELKGIVTAAWNEIEAACEVERKARY